MPPGPDALRGTVDFAGPLKALARGPMHGWGIGQRIPARCRAACSTWANQGSLYPALQRLEYRGLISAARGT